MFEEHLLIRATVNIYGGNINYYFGIFVHFFRIFVNGADRIIYYSIIIRSGVLILIIFPLVARMHNLGMQRNTSQPEVANDTGNCAPASCLWQINLKLLPNVLLTVSEKVTKPLSAVETNFGRRKRSQESHLLWMANYVYDTHVIPLTVCS